MKPCKLNLILAAIALGACPGVARSEVPSTPPPLGEAAATATPAVSASPAGATKATKPPRDPNAPARTPKPHKPPKEIPFPLPLGGAPSRDVKIPDLNNAGEVLQMLMAARAKRVDNDHVQMEETRIDMNKADGKEDYHITMPASVYNLQTRMITSNDPVVISTKDFELTGEKMEFNTVDREGKLLGHVRMVVHNLKEVAGQEPSPTPKPQ